MSNLPLLDLWQRLSTMGGDIRLERAQQEQAMQVLAARKALREARAPDQITWNQQIEGRPDTAPIPGLLGGKQYSGDPGGGLLNPQGGQQGPSEFDRAYRQQAMVAFPEFAKAEISRMAGFVSPDEIGEGAPGTQLYNKRTGDPIGNRFPDKPEGTPDFIKIVDIYKTMSPDDSRRSLVKQYLENSVTPKGMTLTSDGEGGLTLVQGGGGVGLTKTTQTSIEQDLIKNDDAMARLDEIQAGFKPEYQQFLPRAVNAWNTLKNKAGADIDEPTRLAMTDFSEYKRTASSNLNKAIKDATGATVNEGEAPRLMMEIPTPGAGIFDGDSPIDFQAKVQSTRKSLLSAQARRHYAQSKGLSKKGMFAIPLDSIPSVIEGRGNAIKAEVKKLNPSATPQQIEETVKSRLRQEFGL